ncbi:MAG: bifunctional phosphoribosylaminoimidazolecarboxamide formyltransferase/IMP cyclohydrolase [Bacteroidetes bacterium]|nr:bifunctional phosphoribosylaminoimidazolecarboxamide formyltransferase/IMP cyclohydrolase [Bacteroidota bacterium]
MKKINSALISVYSKEGIEPIIRKLNELNVKIFSTGGTFDYIKSIGIEAIAVESITSYPSILGGRVKTLHPKIFGGILGRRELASDLTELQEYGIPEIDLVIVDLYPFEKTVVSTTNETEIIEKIDIGGISLIRAAAKNFKDVVIIPSVDEYTNLLSLLNEKQGYTEISDRKLFAAKAFNVSSHYDTHIFNYFNKEAQIPVFKQSILQSNSLRYGENPHQQAIYHGNISDYFHQLHGKEISYNNMLDIDAAIALITDFEETTFAIIKHNNACGLASRDKLIDAWKDALAADPISAFGGILICNRIVDEETALEINKLFFEIIIAPNYENNALEILKSKKNRIILQKKDFVLNNKQFKTVLNGVIAQERDALIEKPEDLKVVTHLLPTDKQISDMLFANILVKHTKSNAIVLVKDKQLLASGVGQTSRVDALKQAIAKAKSFGFALEGAVMASDAYFPFADSVEIACNEGIKAVIQPGGSVRDQDSIDFCNQHQLAMVFTGNRHFKH